MNTDKRTDGWTKRAQQMKEIEAEINRKERETTWKKPSETGDKSTKRKKEIIEQVEQKQTLGECKRLWIKMTTMKKISR